MKKYVNGKYIELTPAEIAEYDAQQTPTEPTPTLEERLAALENKFSESREEAHGLNERLRKISKMMGIKDE